MDEKPYGYAAISVIVLEKVELAARRSLEEYATVSRQMERFAEELQKIIKDTRNG